MKHVHCDKIIEWAKTGKQVQHADNNFVWLDCQENKPAWLKDGKYRFKPESIKYKRYLTTVNEQPCINSHTKDVACTEEWVERQCYFDKWIDTDWQEYEI